MRPILLLFFIGISFLKGAAIASENKNCGSACSVKCEKEQKGAELEDCYSNCPSCPVSEEFSPTSKWAPFKSFKKDENKDNKESQ